MRKILRAISLALGLALAAPAAVALAQDEDPAASRSATFEAAEGPQAEQVPGGTLLVVAYGIIWLLVFGFVASVALRQTRTAREIARLREDLQAQRTAGSARSEH